MTYTEWIKKNVPDPLGECEYASQEMLKEFPHLRRVRGHYHCHVWGDRQHWWLKDEHGNIIDPTAAQFPSRGCGEYIEFEGLEPTGMCPNCSKYCYDGEYIHVHCVDKFMESL